MMPSLDPKCRAIVIQGATHGRALVAWELLSRFVIGTQFLPPASAIARAFVTTTQSGELPRQRGQTAAVLFMAFGLAVVSGMAVGVAMGTFGTLRRVLDPYVNAFYAM